MKLNIECVRDTLLIIEELYSYGTPVHFNEIEMSISLNSYSRDEIDYTLIKLYEAGYLSGKMKTINGSISSFQCEGLSWNGHQFLDNIRDDKVWKQTKSAISKLSSTSLTIIATVASQILIKILGLN